MINPCANCRNADRLVDISASLETAIGGARAANDVLWNSALEVSEAYARKRLAMPDMDPTERAVNEQMHEYVLDRTARITRVAEEMCDLIGTSMQEAETVDCVATGAIADDYCPRIERAQRDGDMAESMLMEIVIGD